MKTKVRKNSFSANLKRQVSRRKSSKEESIWFKMKPLTSTKVYKVAKSSCAELLLMGSAFGFGYSILAAIFLSYLGVSDGRTFILFAIFYFMYGFWVTSITDRYFISLFIAKVTFLLIGVLVFILANIVAGRIGFEVV